MPTHGHFAGDEIALYGYLSSQAANGSYDAHGSYNVTLDGQPALSWSSSPPLNAADTQDDIPNVLLVSG
jgi:hypothetical protein